MGKIDINHLDIYNDDQPNTEKIRKGKKFKDDMEKLMTEIKKHKGWRGVDDKGFGCRCWVMKAFFFRYLYYYSCYYYISY